MNAWSTHHRPVLTVVLFASVTSVAFSENITYSLVPRTILGIGQATALEPLNIFGELTTNGRLGPLSSDDIVDFSIEVAGPVPHLFVPENEELVLSGNVLATESQILISEHGNLALGNKNGESVCRSSNRACLEWWLYADWFFTDEVQGVVEYGNSPSLPFEGRWTLEVLQDQFQTPSVPFVIAEIPEPSAFTLATVAVIGLLNQARRRNGTHSQKNRENDKRKGHL